VPEGHTFDLIEAPTGNVIGSVTSQQLADGITIELPEKNTAKVFVIRSHPEGIKS